MFDRNTKRDVTLEAFMETANPVILNHESVRGQARRKDEISVDSLDF